MAFVAERIELINQADRVLSIERFHPSMAAEAARGHEPHWDLADLRYEWRA